MDADHLTAERATAGPFRPRTLISFLEDPRLTAQVRAHETGHAERVVVPDLPTGQYMLARVPIKEEHVLGSQYDSVTPWVCEFNQAEVFGPFGITCVGEEVVQDTLPHTRDQVVRSDAGVRPYVSGTDHKLSGTAISLLGPFNDNYYHWTLEGLGRLAAADSAMIEAASHVLVPPLRNGFQHDGLALTGLSNKRIIELDIGDSVEAERLLLPVNMAGEWRPHPRLGHFFRNVSGAVPPPPDRLPDRIYVDRRRSSRRPLANEDEVISALMKYGFVPIQLETLPLAGQITLFRNASMIVAPHGAGLANILFARPGCALIELQMNSYVHWMFRLFSAFIGVDYDCVLGLQSGSAISPQEAMRWIDHQAWTVSVTHLLGAVEHALRSRRS